ncbi:MAG TPA: DUF2147 domain-containing protein [Rhizobiales bacterium]|nr:DUF2147 domain-containing protein [Hyphomicrobiales bacterium]
MANLGIGLMAGMMMTMGAAQAASVDGVWRTEKGWKVKMYKCGGAYCGKVVGGTSAKDIHNPNKALRSRRMVGVRMIWGMKKSGSSYSGKLYNPNDGKTYTGKISKITGSSMRLAGCVFGGLICKSQTWRK